MYLCFSSSENGFTFAAPRGQAGEAEEGNAIYRCALGRRRSPGGVSTGVTREFANVTLLLRTKQAPKMPKTGAQAASTGVSGFCSGFPCLEEDGSEKAVALISVYPVVGVFPTLFFLCALSDDISTRFPQLFPYPQSCSGLWSNWYP